jgi:protein phosphatase
MGGSAYGERASAFCIDRILEDVAGDLPILGTALPFPEDWLTACRQWLLRLNHQVIALSRQLNAPNDVGSTLTAVLFAGQRALVLHVGDSQLYLVRADSVTQVTRSQTYAEQLYQEGLLTRQEVNTSIHRNVLTSYVGSPKCEPEVEELDLIPGDTLVLCTDGLREGLEERDIQEIASRFSPNEAVAEMVNRCKRRLQTASSGANVPVENPYSDNMTAVVVQILGAPTGERIPKAEGVVLLPEKTPARLPDSTLETQPEEGETHA